MDPGYTVLVVEVEHHHMMLEQYVRVIEGEQHRAFTLEGGDAAALLIHGFPGTPAEMRPVTDLLHEVAGEHNLLQTDQPAWPTIRAEITALASSIVDTYPVTATMD